MHEDKTGVQQAHQQVGERQVTESDASRKTTVHGPWTTGAPPRLPVSRMENPRTVRSWLFGQRPGKAGMQADIDEPTTRSEDATGLCCKGREVVHVGVGELRHHQVQGTIRERQLSGISLDQRSPERSGSEPGHSELIGRRIHAHDGPSCASQAGQMRASPAAHIEALAGTVPPPGAGAATLRSRCNWRCFGHTSRRGRRSAGAMTSPPRAPYKLYVLLATIGAAACFAIALSMDT